MSQSLEDSVHTPARSSLKGPPGITSRSECIFKVKMFLNDLIFLQKFWVPSVHLLQSLTESFFGLIRACVFGDVNEIGKKKKRNSVKFKYNRISSIYISYFGILLINRVTSTISIRYYLNHGFLRCDRMEVI